MGREGGEEIYLPLPLSLSSGREEASDRRLRESKSSFHHTGDLALITAGCRFFSPRANWPSADHPLRRGSFRAAPSNSSSVLPEKWKLLPHRCLQTRLASQCFAVFQGLPSRLGCRQGVQRQHLFRRWRCGGLGFVAPSISPADWASPAVGDSHQATMSNDVKDHNHAARVFRRWSGPAPH